MVYHTRLFWDIYGNLKILWNASFTVVRLEASYNTLTFLVVVLPNFSMVFISDL